MGCSPAFGNGGVDIMVVPARHGLAPGCSIAVVRKAGGLVVGVQLSAPRPRRWRAGARLGVRSK